MLPLVKALKPIIWLVLAGTQTALAAPHLQPKAWDPESIPWQRTNPNGTKFALLEGVRDQSGTQFSYAFFIPAGVWDASHSHTADARVFVARGTLYLGYGGKLNRDKAKAFPAGSYLLVPAGAVHFDGSDTDTLIIGTATGPWATTYIAPKSLPSAGTPE
jgi:quercetin dioxygenase-like cupin family protein